MILSTKVSPRLAVGFPCSNYKATVSLEHITLEVSPRLAVGFPCYKIKSTINIEHTSGAGKE